MQFVAVTRRHPLTSTLDSFSRKGCEEGNDCVEDAYFRALRPHLRNNRLRHGFQLFRVVNRQQDLHGLHPFPSEQIAGVQAVFGITSLSLPL